MGDDELYCLECLNDAEPECVINAHPTERRASPAPLALIALREWREATRVLGGKDVLLPADISTEDAERIAEAIVNLNAAADSLADGARPGEVVRSAQPTE